MRRISKGEPPSRRSDGGCRAISESRPAHEKVPIQFKVSAEVRREIKTYTVAHDYEDQSALFVTMWELWKQHQPIGHASMPACVAC